MFRFVVALLVSVAVCCSGFPLGKENAYRGIDEVPFERSSDIEEEFNDETYGLEPQELDERERILQGLRRQFGEDDAATFDDNTEETDEFEPPMDYSRVENDLEYDALPYETAEDIANRKNAYEEEERNAGDYYDGIENGMGSDDGLREEERELFARMLSDYAREHDAEESEGFASQDEEEEGGIGEMEEEGMEEGEPEEDEEEELDEGEEPQEVYEDEIEEDDDEGLADAAEEEEEEDTGNDVPQEETEEDDDQEEEDEEKNRQDANEESGNELEMQREVYQDEEEEEEEEVAKAERELNSEEETAEGGNEEQEKKSEVETSEFEEEGVATNNEAVDDMTEHEYELLARELAELRAARGLGRETRF